MDVCVCVVVRLRIRGWGAGGGIENYDDASAAMLVKPQDDHPANSPSGVGWCQEDITEHRLLRCAYFHPPSHHISNITELVKY